MHLILDAMADGLSYAQALWIQADWYEDHGYPLAAQSLRRQRTPRGFLPTYSPWKVVAAGYRHAVALTAAGKPVSWQYDSVSGAASGVVFPFHPLSFQTPPDVRIEDVAAGDCHNVGLTAQGDVLLWGYGARDWLRVPSGLKAVRIHSGQYHVLAIRPTGEVTAWGWDPETTVPVPEGLQAIALAGGSRHSLALTPEGEVLGWGENLQGQLDIPVGLRAIGLAAGNHHSAALTPQGDVVVWGNHKAPYRRMLPGTSLVAVQAGGPYTGVLTAQGDVLVWSEEEHPQKIPFPDPVVYFALGRSLCTALLDQGTIAVWDIPGWCSRDVPEKIKAEGEEREETEKDLIPDTRKV